MIITTGFLFKRICVNYYNAKQIADRDFFRECLGHWQKSYFRDQHFVFCYFFFCNATDLKLVCFV